MAWFQNNGNFFSIKHMELVPLRGSYSFIRNLSDRKRSDLQNFNLFSQRPWTTNCINPTFPLISYYLMYGFWAYCLVLQATLATTDTSCESVVTSGQHHLTPQHPPRDASPAGLVEMLFIVRSFSVLVYYHCPCCMAYVNMLCMFSRLLSIAEETLTEFLSKATGTAVEWVQMPGMKVSFSTFILHILSINYLNN